MPTKAQTNVAAPVHPPERIMRQPIKPAVPPNTNAPKIDSANVAKRSVLDGKDHQCICTASASQERLNTAAATHPAIAPWVRLARARVSRMIAAKIRGDTMETAKRRIAATQHLAGRLLV